MMQLPKRLQMQHLLHPPPIQNFNVYTHKFCNILKSQSCITAALVLILIVSWERFFLFLVKPFLPIYVYTVFLDLTALLYSIFL